MLPTLSTLFLSHGAPDLVISDCPARDFFRQLATAFGRPKAILAVSAHWETAEPAVNAVEVNATIHDFGGFPKALYAIEYPAPGSPALAQRVFALLTQAGFPARIDTRRGLDHGAWVPLIVAYPAADIPVVQLSVQPRLGPAHHLAVGRALKPLCEEGVLIIGSGSFTHNLYEYFHAPAPAGTGGEPEWVTAFAAWFGRALAENRVDDLVRYREIAPYAEKNHPTEEHLLPLYVALGAAGEQARAQCLHQSSAGTVVRLDAYAFNEGTTG
ncbi:MAG: DODA-type extradiol aromatic ring-opening family dioxygenase [Rhodomicrobium sp.]